ncbi:hypothetical protein GCM10009720_22580 [Yaniella flava]|uniref:DUF3180 domain-containing protein n=1 Tax=Yaniella flava TaxID=287930 RepID=A0ABP5GAL3_9MICC
MTSIRYGWVVLIVLLAAILGWLAAFFTAESGWAIPALGYPAVMTLAAVGVLELILGIRVLKDRQRPVADRMNPVAAARTLVLAQAGTYAGAAFGGWHAGILLHRVPHVGFGSSVVTEATALVVTALVLVIIGFIVEQWCRIPPDDTDGNGNYHQRPPNTSGAQPTTRQQDSTDWSQR